MKTHRRRVMSFAVVVLLAGCAPIPDGSETAPSSEPSVASAAAPSRQASASPSDEVEAFPTAAFADISDDPVPEDVAAKFQAVLDDMAGGGGIAATVMTPDGTWSGAAGTADGVHDVQLDSQFGIASGTKPIIAAQVMQLVEAGEISLDAPATDYLPADFTFDTNGATIRQLLSHRSGIPDWYSDAMEERMATDRSRVWELDEVLALVGAARRPVGVLRIRGHQLQPARARHRARSPTTARRRPARWRPPRRRDGAAHLPARRGPDRPDGHAARRVARRARAGRRLPAIHLRCELRRCCGRHGVRFDLARTLVAGVLRRRDRFGSLADRDVDVLRQRRQSITGSGCSIPRIGVRAGPWGTSVRTSATSRRPGA